MLRLLLPLLLSTTPAFAVAAEPPSAGPAATVTAPPEVDVDDDDEPENGVSARLLLGSSLLPDEGTLPLVGAGVAYKRELYGLVGVEVALEGVASPVGQAYLIEMLAEKPIEVNDVVGLYFGGGPTVALQVEDGKLVPGAGGLAMGGVEFFVSSGIEVFVELDAAVLLFERPELETDLGTGVLYRF